MVDKGLHEKFEEKNRLLAEINTVILAYDPVLRGKARDPDTARELARIARRLGLETPPDRLRNVIERCSADRMREPEKLEENRWANKKHRKDIPFVRVAKARDWRNTLPEPCVAQIQSAWGDYEDTWQRTGLIAKRVGQHRPSRRTKEEIGCDLLA